MGKELREEAAVVTAGAPLWLGPLLGARFFQPCAEHPNLNGNHYCLDCAGEDDAVSCPRCLLGHRSHHVVQLEAMVSDHNLTFILDRKRKRDEPESEETGEEDDDNMPLLEATNLQTPRWISHRRRARKGVPVRAPFK